MLLSFVLVMTRLARIIWRNQSQALMTWYSQWTSLHLTKSRVLIIMCSLVIWNYICYGICLFMVINQVAHRMVVILLSGWVILYLVHIAYIVSVAA